jgi:hypothetical protein
MSSADRSPSNRPAPNAKPEPLHRAISARFHPPIKLERSKGLQFAGKLSSAIDATGVELLENKWQFAQPLGTHAAGQFTVIVADSNIQIEVVFPSDSEELFETKAGFILREFEKFFSPELLLGSGAIIRATLQIDGDARAFLAEHVTHFDIKGLGPLKRPVYGYGIRLLMPPYKTPAKPQKKAVGKKPAKPRATEVTEWNADVKAESFIEDYTKLFLEVDGQWQVPHQWKDNTGEEVTGRLATVSKFITTNFIPFLTSCNGE